MSDAPEILQKTEFPIFNGYAPLKTGPKAIPITLDFTTLAERDFDLIDATARGVIDFVQSIWVDNSDNDNSLTLTFSQTAQRLVVPANAQGIWPVIAPQGLRCVATTTPGVGVICQIILMNVPMPMTQFGPVTVQTLNVTASATPVQSNITTTSYTLPSGLSTQALAANGNRKRIVLQAAGNNAGPLTVQFGGGATLGAGLTLGPGERWDSGTGPVDARLVQVIGTANDVINIWES